MNFFTLATIRQAIAPQHKISCSLLLWWRLLRALKSRGRDSTRESGAFLVGRSLNGRKRIVDFILYDDLDPHCLESGIVRFDGRYFSELWSQCKSRDLSVVADIHVHPGCCRQSQSDKAHPMIVSKGHIAMILPRFAQPPQSRKNVGIYLYCGGNAWTDIPQIDRRHFFHIGL